MSWQKHFKKRIYLRNYKNFKKEKENFYEQEEAKNEAIWKLMHEYPEKIIFKSVKDD